MVGALAHYITTKEATLQPINSNWGLVPAAPKRENGRRLTKPERRQRQARMALAALEDFVGPKARSDRTLRPDLQLRRDLGPEGALQDRLDEAFKRDAGSLGGQREGG